jgi:outer membrane protein TolC
MILRFTYLALVVLALTCGCAIYHPQPLDSASVEAALQPPKLEAVKIAAAKIEHPLLKPILIDGHDGFSPDEIAVMVVIVSPELRALRDQRGVANAQVLQAGILPNPQFGYTFDQLHGDAAQAVLSGPLTNGNSYGLSWDTTALLVHHDAVAAAKASGQALDLAIAWQEWQAAQDARLRAFRLLSLDQRLPLAREIEDDLADNVKVTQQALSLGQKTYTDLTAAIETWTQAQNNRFALEQQITTERAALNLALGQPADAPLRLKPATVFPVSPADLAPDLLQGLEKRRLDLVALTLGYQSEEATLRAAVIAQFPKIGLNIGRATDTTDVHTISYGVTVDVPLFDRNQGQIAIGRATRQQLFDEYVARVAEARSEVTQILADLDVTRAQLQAVDDSLPQTEQFAASLTKEYQARNADVLAYRDARGTLATRRMEQIQLQQSLLELSVALEIATGRPLLNRGTAN